MNRLNGIIVYVEANENLSLVDVNVDGDKFTCVVLDPTFGHLPVGHEVQLVFEESAVQISKDFNARFSVRNRFRGKVTELEHGRLLTRVVIDFLGHPVTALITTRSALQLSLSKSDAVEGLVNPLQMFLIAP